MTSENIEKKKGPKKALVIALVLMLLLLAGWYLILPVLGVAVVLTVAVWGVVLATVILFVLGILLFYLFTGVGILIICILGLVWFIGALVFFPFLFPLLLPLLILLLVIAFVRKKKA